MNGNKIKCPLVLDIVTFMYFMVGVFAFLEFLAGKSADLVGMGLLLVAISLFLKKPWSLIALKVIVIIQLVMMLPVLLIAVFSDSGTANLLVAGQSFSIHPLLAVFSMAIYLGIQSYAAFSKETAIYFSTKTK